MTQEDLQTRDRILATAFSLFLERGYEKTPVQAIIDAVGIAKGTFYHHFKGKEEMLVALVEGMSRRVFDAIVPVAEDPTLDAAAKMLALSRVAVRQKIQDFGPEVLVLIRQMRSRANRLLADAIDEISHRWILPVYAGVVRQGVAEGLFRVHNADLAAELVLGAILSMQDRITDLILAAVDGDALAPDRLTDLYRSIEEAVERILGAPVGSLPIYSVIDVRDLVARLSSGGHR